MTDTTADEPEGTGWLVLIYRVPPEPTRLRSTVWRRIKSLGAIYLQNSAAALPASAATERALRKLRREILDMSGTAILLSCDVLAGEPDVRSAFQAARNDEYEEIVDRCEDFLQQVQKEYTANHFTYAELEENEVDLVKLRNWFAKVRERDAFGAEGRQPAEKALDDMRAVAGGLCRPGVRRGSGEPLTSGATPRARMRSSCGRVATARLSSLRTDCNSC